MNNKLIVNVNLKMDIEFFFRKNLNILYLKGRFGTILIYLPRFYYFKLNLSDEINFLFLNKWFFKTFLKQFFFFYKIFFKFYFFRIKLKGLGYRIRKMTNKLYRFFVAYNHYIYFYVSSNVFIWTKKRNLLALSIDKIKLNNIFYHLLMLKKMDFYEKSNSFIVPKKILYIKK